MATNVPISTILLAAWRDVVGLIHIGRKQGRDHVGTDVFDGGCAWMALRQTREMAPVGDVGMPTRDDSRASHDRPRTLREYHHVRCFDYRDAETGARVVGVAPLERLDWMRETMSSSSCGVADV